MIIVWILILLLVIYGVIGLLISNKLYLLLAKEKAIYEEELSKKIEKELYISNNTSDYYDAYLFMI